MADGCHLNRDPTAAISAAGLSIVDMERFAMPAGNPLIRIGVSGCAVRSSGEGART
jgi:hypothetical protein